MGAHTILCINAGVMSFTMNCKEKNKIYEFYIETIKNISLIILPINSETGSPSPSPLIEPVISSFSTIGKNN